MGQEAGYHLHTGRQEDVGLDYTSQGLLTATQFLQQGSLSERLHNLYKQYSWLKCSNVCTSGRQLTFKAQQQAQYKEQLASTASAERAERSILTHGVSRLSPLLAASVSLDLCRDSAL